MIKLFKTTTIASLLLFLTSLKLFGQNLDRPKLTKTIIEALKNSNLDTLLKLTIDKTDFEYLAKNEKKKYDIDKINYEVSEERKNIEYRYKKLMRTYDPNNPKWDSTTISRIIYATEKVSGNSFSSILVELLYNQKKYYLEIDTVLTANGWKIKDDIMTVYSDIDNRIKYKNRKMIQY